MHILQVFCLLVALGLSAAILPETTVDYSGHKVVSVLPKSKENLQMLESFERKGLIKYWMKPSGLNRLASIQISGDNFELISNILAEQALSPIILIENIQELIEKQKSEIRQRQFENANSRDFDFENFHVYSELLAFMEEMAANNSIVTYSIIGQSYEGRDIGQVAVRTGNPGVKQIIFLECGVHAREWITESTCIWIFDQLVNGYGVDPEITVLLDKYDWIIVPTSNPDGYEFSWTSDRLWRKNRAVTNNNTICPGVDLNRNYDANFGGDGSSPLACSETYHGVSAFSESESVAIRDSLAANRGFVKAFVSVHSYGGIWMSPYGYVTELPLEYEEMYRVMAIGSDAITATYGTPFEYANEAAILYLTSGTTRDYAYVGENIIYAYTIETRGKIYGFIPPPSEILVTAIETWNGIKAMANNLL